MLPSLDATCLEKALIPVRLCLPAKSISNRRGWQSVVTLHRVTALLFQKSYNNNKHHSCLSLAATP